MRKCRTCTNPTALPYYRKGNDGKVFEGCIDLCHKDVHDPEYKRWFNRKNAKVWRKLVKAHILDIQMYLASDVKYFKDNEK